MESVMETPIVAAVTVTEMPTAAAVMGMGMEMPMAEAETETDLSIKSALLLSKKFPKPTFKTP
jgi:hypothetical protein